MENHPQCSSPESTPLSKRLLHIDNTTEPPTVKVVSSPNIPTGYVTLSHCWGSQSLLMTKRASLRRHEQSIDWHLLSKTFQDAIHVTNRLGVNFIWIDSLCIVQDDHDEWLSEASKMASIYSQSVFTIAATRAHNGDDGCFSFRKTLFHTRKEYPTNGDDLAEFVPAVLRCVTTCYTPNSIKYELPRRIELIGNTGSYTDNAGLPFEVHTRLKRDHFLDLKRFIHEVNDNDLPLLGRAWAFQEQLLAARVLHYTNLEIIVCAHTPILASRFQEICFKCVTE